MHKHHEPIISLKQVRIFKMQFPCDSKTTLIFPLWKWEMCLTWNGWDAAPQKRETNNSEFTIGLRLNWSRRNCWCSPGTQCHCSWFPAQTRKPSTSTSLIKGLVRIAALWSCKLPWRLFGREVMWEAGWIFLSTYLHPCPGSLYLSTGCFTVACMLNSLREDSSQWSWVLPQS